MSAISEELRAAVAARALNRCEYCHLPAEGQVGRFPIDHIVPRTLGGLTEMENLAFACPHCNAHKWAHTDGRDNVTGTEHPLFNPRFELWPDHFHWTGIELVVLEGRTPVGRATIATLQMNHPNCIEVRRLMARLGIFGEYRIVE